MTLNKICVFLKMILPKFEAAAVTYLEKIECLLLLFLLHLVLIIDTKKIIKRVGRDNNIFSIEIMIYHTDIQNNNTN